MDSITLSTNEKSYTLTPLGTNALCALEDRLGKPFGTLMDEIGGGDIALWRLSTTRIFLQECLVEKLSEEEIGTLIDAIGFDGISTAVNGLIWPARKVAADG